MEFLTGTVLFVILLLDLSTGRAGLIQGPTPVSVLTPVGSFVEFNCTVNLSELPANTYFDPIRWKVNNAILRRMGQSVLGSTVSLEVTKSYITAAASVQCSTELNGTIQVSSDTTATLTAYGQWYV